MPGTHTTSKVVRFGEYEVDLLGGVVRKGRVRISLREQSFQVLVMLLERPGQVVTREELRRRLWRDDVFVDFDNNLNSAIARLREAICDSVKHPRYIETLPKHGYRFIADVFEPPQAAEAEKPQRTRLLVLPFVNLSGDPAQEYFSDGMTDEIITELAALAPEQLAVIARTTAMYYKRSPKNVAQIGRELNVDYVLEGGVHRGSNQVGINANLIRTKDQAQIWAQRFDAETSDIFQMQGGVAQEIARHIGTTQVAAQSPATDAVHVRQRRKFTIDFIAYNEYLLARQITSTTSEAFAKARQHLEKAIARDPQFALAYDALAEIYWWLGYVGLVRPVDAFSKGVLYAVRALEIDNTLAETHALLAQYHKQREYNWAEVERGMACALALNPNSPIVRYRYAWNFLMPHGRLKEAVAEFDSALELDPLSAIYRTALVITLLVWRQYDRVLTEAQRLIDLDPNTYWAHFAIGACHRDRGMFQEALAFCRRAAALSGDTPIMLGWLGLFCGLAGKKTEARGLLNRLNELSSKVYVPPTSIAWIHIGLKEIDAAFKWLDRAVNECDQLMMPIKSYAFFDPLRSDQRFAALLRKMKLES